MSLLHLKLESITEADLQRLVDDRMGETKLLEFKQALQVETDDQKREFLSDVTAMANSEGGEIIYGIAENEGVAADLCGLRNFNEDQTLGKLENLLRDSVQPRLKVLFRVVALASGNTALLVRVPRSLTAPHMVRHQGITRFCGRNANGKYDLDVHELRSAFVANESFGEKLKNFRLDRLNRIISGETMVPMVSPHHVVLHLLPVESARNERFLNGGDFRRLQNTLPLSPPSNGNSWGPRTNFDGFLVNSETRERKSFSYVQFFRNGSVEIVDAWLLEPRPNPRTKSEEKLIHAGMYEARMIDSAKQAMDAVEVLGFEPPVVLGFSMLNVRGFLLHPGSGYHFDGSAPVSKDHLITSEILIEDRLAPIANALRPAFDQIWNACGFDRSFNFDADGNWKPRS